MPTLVGLTQESSLVFVSQLVSVKLTTHVHAYISIVAMYHMRICTTLRGWIKGTTLSLYTANHKEYLQVPIRVVRRHRVSSN